MKRHKQKLPLIFSAVMLSVCCAAASAQQTDSIFFHLYTDSLKKGTYNYINVDRWRDGRWFPLTDKELSFSATGGRFERSSLFLDTGFAQEKVVVTAVLKSDSTVARSVTIFIKKQEDHEILQTKEEALRQPDPQQRKKGNR